MVSRSCDHDVLHVWETKWGGNVCDDGGNRKGCCTVTIRLRTVCQSGITPAHGLSVQKCSCTRSDSAAMLLRTVFQCRDAPAHFVTVQQCSCARSVSAAMLLYTVWQCSNAPAHVLSVQKCACSGSDSAAMLLRTVCQCSNASEHAGLSVRQFLPAKIAFCTPPFVLA
jgi:hypothetical protein